MGAFHSSGSNPGDRGVRGGPPAHPYFRNFPARLKQARFKYLGFVLLRFSSVHDYIIFWDSYRGQRVQFLDS